MQRCPRTTRLLRVLFLLAAMGLGMPRIAPAARGKSDENPAERVASGIQDNVQEGMEWLQRRRTFTMNRVPYGLTGMPIIFYAPSSGFHYGGWVEIANYKVRPYKYRINVQWWLSTIGKRNHHLRFESPEVFGWPVNVRFMTQDLKDTGTNYFGVGNDTQINKDAQKIEPDYYRYLLEQQKTALDLEARIFGPATIFAGARFNRGVPTRINEAKNTYFVFSDPTLPGLEAGWTNFLVAGLIIDTRDDQELPTNGILSEISVQKGYEWLGTDYSYRRLTFIHSHYHALGLTRGGPRYVVVARALLEYLTGDIPFYELTEVGGSIRGFEVGGNAAMRGYESRRFADKQKLLLTVELRRSFRNRTVRGQYLQTQGILFGDVGRVAPTLRKLTPGGLHPSGGAGFRIIWNSQLSLRADFAISPEGHRYLLTFGNLF